MQVRTVAYGDNQHGRGDLSATIMLFVSGQALGLTEKRSES